MQAGKVFRMTDAKHELSKDVYKRQGEGGLKLTAEGEIIVKYAKRIKMLYQNLQQTLLDEKKNATSLSVGITHTAESNLMAEVLARYCSQHKGLRLKPVSYTHLDSLQG